MRERCADVADTCDSPYGCATQEQDYACSDMAYRIAAAIRALSTKREDITAYENPTKSKEIG